MIERKSYVFILTCTHIFQVSCRAGHDAKQQSNNYVCRLVSRATLLIYLFMIFVPIASFLLGVITLFQPFNYLAFYTWRLNVCVTPSFVNDQRPVDLKQVCRSFFFLHFQKRFLSFVPWIKSNEWKKNRSIEMDLGVIIMIIMWQNEPLTDLVGNVNPLNGQSHMSHCSANTSRMSPLAMCVQWNTKIGAKLHINRASSLACHLTRKEKQLNFLRLIVLDSVCVQIC